MKKLFTLILSLFILQANAQDCGYMDRLDKDDQWAYNTYNAKDKLEGSIDYKVTNTRESDDSSIVELDMTVTDKKDESMNLTYEMACINGTVYVDMDRMIGPMIEQMQGMEFEVQSDQIEIPSNLNVGDVLPEASITVTAGMNGVTFMTMTVVVKDRKVTAIETITTPAGTFECYVIEQTTEIQNRMMSKSTTSKEWYSPENGMVRSESYKSNGKLENYSVLTEANF
ncbi:MAG: hypothetical protein JXR19_10925 [Bacteroidia bacterium]